MDSRLRAKTAAFAVFVILSNSFGNLFIALGMRQSEDVTGSALALLAAIANPWVVLGIVSLIAWLLARMTMLGWADLTYVLPVTALGYAISAGLGAAFLNEQVTPVRWTGVLLIVAGVVLVGLGSPHPERPR